MNAEHHIHANHFLEEEPKSKEKLEQLGFVAKKATYVQEGKPTPLWLITHRSPTRSECDTTTQQALRILEQDETFQGYLETEVVAPGHYIQYEQKPFNSRKPFFIRDVELAPGEKEGDLHVYRHRDSPRDQLDDLLLANGFFEVWTDASRIYTLEVAKGKEREKLFERAKGFFGEVGGIKGLESEVVRDLIPFPKDFALRPVAHKINYR